MKVSDIMTRNVISVNPETSLREAASFFAKFCIHGMPVVDSKNKIVGFITESDFFIKDSSNIFLSEFLGFVRSEKGNTTKNDGKKGGEKKLDGIVQDIMTAECFTVKEDLPIEKLVYMFKEKKFNSIPIVDENNVLIGIVTIMDVIKLL